MVQTKISGGQIWHVCPKEIVLHVPWEHSAGIHRSTDHVLKKKPRKSPKHPSAEEKHCGIFIQWNSPWSVEQATMSMENWKPYWATLDCINGDINMQPMHKNIDGNDKLWIRGAISLWGGRRGMGDAGNLNHLSKLSSLSEIRCKYDNVRIW